MPVNSLRRERDFEVRKLRLLLVGHSESDGTNRRRAHAGQNRAYSLVHLLFTVHDLHEDALGAGHDAVDSHVVFFFPGVDDVLDCRVAGEL